MDKTPLVNSHQLVVNKKSDKTVVMGALMTYEWICKQEEGNRRYWVHPYNKSQEEENTLQNLIIESR